MKTCRICSVEKPLHQFHRTGMKDGHRGECKACFRELARARYDSKAAVARTTQWRKDNSQRFAEYQAEYRNRPERKRKMRDLYYRRAFGLTADEVDALLASQGGVCAICGEAPDRAGALHVDHDHDTGRIRGILCSRCNHAIGLLREDPELVERAAAYLRG